MGNQGAAATADGVVGITTILAQGKFGSACVVAGPKPSSAMAADQSVKLQTMGTEFLAAEVAQLLWGQCLAAERTGTGMLHGKFLHILKIGLGELPRGLHSYNIYVVFCPNRNAGLQPERAAFLHEKGVKF